MLNRNDAVLALQSIVSLTDDIELNLQNWPARMDEELKTLTVLQERNRHVYPLSRTVANARGWNETLATEVTRFLLEELEEENGLLKQKLRCLHVSGTLRPTWGLTLQRLLSDTKEVREGAMLFCDLYAFDALGTDAFEKYQLIFEPIAQQFQGRVVVTRVDRTDTLYAYVEPLTDEALKTILEFASALRRRIVNCRSSMMLPDAVNFGIGVAIGGLKFSKITEKVFPDSSGSSAGAWYEAAKLMSKAERLAKHLSERGGAILVSDGVNDRLGKPCVRRNMNTFDPKFPDSEVNIYDEPQGAIAR